MNELAERVKRDASPLRRSFVERKEGDDEPTPLARLLRTQEDAGGKGGGLRIALLLSLIWVCVRPPFKTTRVAPYWAELLGREDPQGEGARAIRDCLRDLRTRSLIELQPAGSSVEISLNKETSSPGNVLPYAPPYALEEPYLSVPRAFWVKGIAGSLSGAAIAMYLSGLALTSHERYTFYVSAAFFEARFGISRSSRKRGLSELVSKGVLSVEMVETIDVETFRKRRRNVYTVLEDFRQPAPWVNGESTAAEPAEDKSDVKASKLRGA